MMLLNNEETVLGGLMADLRRIFAAFACVALLTVFIALLFAPLLESWLCRDLERKACGDGASTAEEIRLAELKLTIVRVGLWITAILAWLILIAANFGFNLYGY